MKRLTRKKFLTDSLRAGAGLSVLPILYRCGGINPSGQFAGKIVVLGIDGMDPSLTADFISQGLMPNFKRLADRGSLKKMSSSIPPQSPVAWSEFAVGADASVHGIFDFIHRDPAAMTPYLSTSRVTDASVKLPIGSFEIPIAGGGTAQLRKGVPFWEYIGRAGIPATIFKMPGEFPAVSSAVKTVSGMGTPDLLGSYGTFSFFTSNPPANREKITGGRVIPVKIIKNKIETELTGPPNTFKKNRRHMRIPVTIFRDPENITVKIVIQKQELVMTAGEWSDWVRVSFDYLPHLASAGGICRIYVKQVHPHFEMYVSPINIDPADQALPVTGPEEYGIELAREVGLFNTKGLPADTKALSYGILSDSEYLQISRQILDESRKLLNYELDRLKSLPCGFLFYYFSNLDQDSHMFWRAADKKSPLYSDETNEKYSNVIKSLYIEMDSIIGDVYSRFNINDENFRLIVLSDHGFAPFNRCVNLNTWLLKNNYISFYGNRFTPEGKFFQYVDWSRTKAYGLGINSLYINRQGRERFGIVPESDAGKLMEEIKNGLLEMEDPATGEKAVSSVWTGRELFKREDNTVPDMIIGWNRGYRASWETILGEFTESVFTDNTDKWSGDHCIDPAHVPAVLASNKEIELERPSLPDVTATILAECGIPVPGQMTGRLLYRMEESRNGRKKGKTG